MRENVKRVFYVRHLAHPCYLDLIAQRPEIRLDRLEHDTAEEVAAPITAAVALRRIMLNRSRRDVDTSAESKPL